MTDKVKRISLPWKRKDRKDYDENRAESSIAEQPSFLPESEPNTQIQYQGSNQEGKGDARCSRAKYFIAFRGTCYDVPADFGKPKKDNKVASKTRGKYFITIRGSCVEVPWPRTTMPDEC